MAVSTVRTWKSIILGRANARGTIHDRIQNSDDKIENDFAIFFIHDIVMRWWFNFPVGINDHKESIGIRQ